MTHPQELREHTYFNDPSYPFNLFRLRQTQPQKDTPSFYLHWHDHFEILLMVEGRAVFYIDSKPYEAESGDIIIVPSGALHAGYCAGEGPLEYYALVFNAALLSQGKTPDPKHTLFITPYLDGGLLFPIQLTHTDALNLQYKHILEELIQEFEGKQPGYELIIKSQLYMLLTLLSRRFMPDEQQGRATLSHKRNADRFKKLLRHIDTHYAEPITVSDAAAMMNLNPYHFCKIFKKTTGSTLIEYVNFIRINEAMKLLSSSDLTVTEIAGQIGCGNPNYFTKLFKQYKGVTPSQWRREAAGLS
ncbi:AraC family transcriptional regulator [Paenibacillus lentus]|uniref:AraC family transcriptional regulator n=1 Tax=Paenibacillus lentus TaxID=1338368 RepID=A0A3Q8SDY4_9BACL|nr:AraC family transcriptional regulator [Paenibacillus lentus]AZK48477.1 AraC family transcriptional regulator [Paenibacillus lentus]